MRSKHENDPISRKVMDSLTDIVTIVTIVVGMLGVFLPEKSDAEKYVWGSSIVLAVTSGIFLFFRYRRAQKLKIADEMVPLSETAALRGLLPFEEGDQLPGRGRDVQDLYTLVTNSTFRFGVLCGESGCGKTSVLRAGLIPKLREGKFLPIYIHKPTKNPLEAIRSELIKTIPSASKNNDKSLNQLLKTAVPKGSKIVIILDQFEEFFLTNRTAKSRASFINWLGDTAQKDKLHIAVLIGIRSDFLAHLRKLAPTIPDPTSIYIGYELQNFDTEQAKQIFSAAAKADGIPFKPELIQAVINELEVEEFVRPAELQVVGTRLKRKNIVTLNKYEAIGGARGILSSYISDEIKQSLNEQVARLILRLMCADTLETKSPMDLSTNDVLRGISGSPKTDSAQAAYKELDIRKILEQFVNARVLIRTDEDKYNLAHDYLAPYIRTATEGVETNAERANRLLKRYVAEYKDDPKTRIPVSRIRFINKYASLDLKTTQKAREVLRKSKRWLYSIAAIPLILMGSLYFFLASSYYFSIDDNTDYVVLRSGNPRLEIIPGFDHVIIQTDFTKDDILANYQDQKQLQTISGFWFEQTKEGGTRWLDQLLNTVDSEGQIQILLSLNISTTTNKLEDPNYSIRASAASALGLIAQISPQSIPPDVVPKLVRLLEDPNSDVWTRATSALRSIAQASPQSITPDVVPKLVMLLENPNSNLRYSAASVLESIALANPRSITPDIVTKLVELLKDPDLGVRYKTAFVLGSIAQASPQSITPDVVSKLVGLLENPYTDLNSVAIALSSVAQANPQSITPDVVSKLVGFLEYSDHDSRDSAASALSSIAQASHQSITPDVVQKLIGLLEDPNFYFVDSTASALGSIAQASPQSITPDVVPKLVKLLENPNSDVSASAMSVLGSIAQASPQSITPDVVSKLVGLLQNPDDNVRASGAYSLGSIAQACPQSINPDVVPNLVSLLDDPNLTVGTSGAYSLGSIAQACPQSINPDVVPNLVSLLDDPNPNTRLSAKLALSSFVPASPQSITPDVVAKLVRLLENPDDNVRARAASALGLIAQISPQTIPPDVVQKLVGLLEDPNLHVRYTTGSILGFIAQASPQSITPDVVQKLVKLLEVPSSPVKYMTDSILGSIAQASPQCITPDVVQKLVGLLNYPDREVRDSATSALGSIAQARPRAFTPDIVSKLIGLLENNNIDVRASAASVLGFISQASPQNITANHIEYIFHLLKGNKCSTCRSGATYALFEIALNNLDYHILIKLELDKVQNSTNFYSRMSARRVLEMIAVGDLMDEAQINPEKIEQIKSRLAYLSNSDDKHTRYAAGKILAEIEKLELKIDQ